MLLVALAGCPLPEDKSETGTQTDDSATTGALPGPTGPSRAQPDCAPDDGAAVRFIIGMAEDSCDADYSSVPHLRLDWWGGGAPLAPGTYAFDHSTGSAWYDRAGGGAEEYGTTGELVIDSWAGDVVTGSYTVNLDSGEVVAGEFTAGWCETTIMCG